MLMYKYHSAVWLGKKQQWNFYLTGWQKREFLTFQDTFLSLQLFHALKQNCVSRCMYNISWTVNVFWRFESCLDNKNNNCDHAIARIQSQITHTNKWTCLAEYRTESTVHIYSAKGAESSLSNWCVGVE